MTAKLLLLASLAAATAAADWADLSHLRPGHKLTIVTADRKYIEGRFVSVTEESLTVKPKDADLAVPRAQIVRVSSRERGQRLRNALIGAGAGALTGYLIGVASYGHKDDYQTVRTFGALVGLGGGAGIGAAIPSHPTLYRAPANSFK